MTTNDDILKFFNTLKDQAEKNTSNLRKDMKNVNSRLNDLTEKVETAKNDSVEKENRDEKIMKEVQVRLEQIELKLTAAEVKCKDREKIAMEQSKRTNDFKNAVGLEINEPEKVVKPKTWTEILKENKDRNEERIAEDKENKMKTWRKQVMIRQKVKKIDSPEEKKEADEKIEELKEIKREARKEALKMGDSPKHSEEDWSWDECDPEWEGTAGKKEAENKKKIERYRRKKNLEKKTATKAKHILGIGPIRRESIGYFFEATADWELSKKMAVNEYLEEYLQFNTDDINDFEVIKTLTSKSDDEILYATFAELESIKEIHKRVAELKNDEIMIRNYIPPQFWERYRHLSKYCADLRSDDPNLKTKIQFNDKDVEVLTKLRRSDEPFKVLDLKEIEAKGPIPRFDHSISWKRRSDRPPRNPTKKVEGKICPPSLRQSSLQRQRSSSLSESSSKRQKTFRDRDPLEQVEVIVVADSPEDADAQNDQEDQDSQDMDL